MNKYKKSAVLGLTMFLCTIFVNSCNNKPKQTINVDVWTYYTGNQKNSFNKYVDLFNETVGAKKKIKISHINFTKVNSLTDSIVSSALGDAGAPNLPGLFQIYADDLFRLGENINIVSSFNNYFTPTELEKFVPGYLSEGTINNEIKILPVAKSTECFLLNKTLWDEFAEGRTDVSLDKLKTHEGIREVAALYYQATGKAFYGRDALANYVFVSAKSLGKEIITYDQNNNIKVEIDEDVFRKIYDNYYVPFVKGHFDANGKFRSDDVNSGKIIAYTGATSSASYFPKQLNVSDDQKRDIDCYAIEAPLFENGEPYAMQQGAGFSMIKQSEDKEKACVEFLKFLTQKENNLDFAVGASYLPAVKVDNPMETIKEIIVKNNYKGDGNPTEEEKNTILNNNSTLVSVYENSIKTVNESTMWTSIPFEHSSALRQIFESCIQGPIVSYRATNEIVNANTLRFMIEEDLYQGTPEEYFQTWFSQLTSAVDTLVN